eukprot:2944218-Amphidinium_carterae.1
MTSQGTTSTSMMGSNRQAPSNNPSTKRDNPGGRRGTDDHCGDRVGKDEADRIEEHRGDEVCKDGIERIERYGGGGVGIDDVDGVATTGATLG